VDFNNDGYLDLISGDRNGFVNYFSRLPNGELTTEAQLVANGVTIDVGLNSAPHIIDWNEDGLLDMVIGNDTDERVWLYLNSGTPSNYVFTSYSHVLVSGTPIVYSRCNPHVTDLNLDGKKDLVIGEDWGSIYYLENEGTNAAPVFNQAVQLQAEGVPISFPSGYTDLKVWVNDWDEDGTPDLVVGNYDDSVHLYIAYPLGVAEGKSEALSMVNRVAPNPALGRTSIHYQVMENGTVELAIYDINGRLVTTLVSEDKSAGEYSVVWNGLDIERRRVPAGVYFYRLTTQDNIDMDKLIRLR
jgi:hypothetical protein